MYNFMISGVENKVFVWIAMVIVVIRMSGL